MSDTNANPPAEPEAPSADPQPMIAGKYKTADDAIQGLNEINEKIGFPKLSEQEVGFLQKDPGAIEAKYRAASTIMGRLGGQQNQPPQDPPPPDATHGSDGKGDKTRDDQGRFAAGLNVEPPQITDESSVEDILDAAGLQNDKIVDQWTQNGKLDDAAYESLKKLNPAFTRKVVDSFIAGQHAAAQGVAQRQQQIVTEAQQLVGGQEQLDNLIGWAARNIDRDALGDPQNPAPGTINHRLKDPKLWRGAITELRASYSEATGGDQSRPLVGGGQSGAGGAAPYQSLREFTAACNKMSKTADEQARIAATYRQHNGNPIPALAGHK